MAVTRLKQHEFYRLVEWLKAEEKGKRLDGLDRKTVAARAHQDLKLSVEITEYHIKNVADITNIKWNGMRRVAHSGNTATVAAVGYDLRELATAMVHLMNELGIDKSKTLYQTVLKLSVSGGIRTEEKQAA